MKNVRNKVLAAVMLLCLISMLALPGMHAKAAESSTGRVVRVACGMNDALYLNDAGEPEGICLSYLRQLAWNMNWTLEYVEGSYNESMQNLIDGKVDLIQELLNEVNQSMSISMVNTPDIVRDMFYSILKGYNIISMTREEHDKVESANVIRVGVYSDCLPLAGLDSDGQCVGIYVDLLKELAAESGLNMEIVPVEDSNRLYSYLDDGTVDLVIGEQELRFYQENADNHLASNGITDYTTAAVTMPDYQFDSDDQQVFALTRARNYLEKTICEKYPSAKIQYYDNRKECLDAVKSGKADATFLNTWEYNYESKNARFQDLIEWESIRISSVIGLGGTRQSDLELLSILEKTISQMPSEKISEIITANLNMPYSSYNLYDRFYAVKNEVIVAALILVAMIVCMGIYMHVKRKYIKDLIVANKTKSDFLSRMSHELRTPLNAIMGYANITKESIKQAGNHQENEGVVDNMNSITSASSYLLGIIKDILDIQSMETGKFQLEKTEINPREYMRMVVKMIQPMADEKKINFTYNMINGAEDNYVMDGGRVQQILLNLLYNAVKFTPAGGSVIMTSEVISKDEKDATLRFEISDTGIGMSEEFMKNGLFHKFAQENENLTSPYEGCGNGLAICKELVDRMDGEITCVSELGKGSKFTVVIKAEYRRQEQKRRARRPAQVYDLNGKRVLMCEDNPMNQDMEKRLLVCMNCKVDIADDGKIGLDKFAESPIGNYDVILMDIRMPNMDGLEATKAIRALDREDAREIPIIAISANAFEEDVKMSLDAGMNEHLPKPIDARVLYEKIQQYCG